VAVSCRFSRVARFLPVLIVGWGWAGVASAQSSSPAPPDPVATIRSFDHRLRHVLRRHFPEWSPEADLAKIQIHELVDQTLSIPELARGSLGNHWGEATEQQRRTFLSLFRELLVRRIATGQLLDYEPETTPKLILHVDDVADVGMVIHEGEPTAEDPRRASVDYKLRYLAGRWQLVDLLVDDRSVVGEYRYQFDRIIARETIEGLLERMRKKVG